MNGAEALWRTLAAAGLEVCFSNPGTTELHLLAGLARVPGLRHVLALQEGVVTGAADGYARMAGRAAAGLLHLGPGLANGLANLHNARKARTPVLALVGQHARAHHRVEAPLSADVEAFARPVSRFVASARDARTLAEDAARAWQAAQGPPPGVATLVVPADAAWADGGKPAAAPASVSAAPPRPEAVEAAAAALRGAGASALLVGGAALSARGLAAASRVAARSGARLHCDTFNARLERGAGLPRIDPLPYFPEQAEAALAGLRRLVRAGTGPPVAFFAYPGRRSELAPVGCEDLALAEPGEDAEAALEALAEALGADGRPPSEALAARERFAPPSGALDAESIGRSLTALLPEHAVVAEEAITCAAPLVAATRGAAPHTWLGLTGGAIGQGMPVATGAAVACPGRRVVCLEADGSALYTHQALWTQAHEGLDVTTVLLANRGYEILRLELGRLGLEATPEISLDIPRLDAVRLAEGLGVPASRAESAQELHRQLERALSEPGPHLIEAVLAPAAAR